MTNEANGANGANGARRRCLLWVFGGGCELALGGARASQPAPSSLDASDPIQSARSPSPPNRPLSLPLAQVAPDGIDPTGYLVSEKLDGVRAVWSGGAERQLRFRSGAPITLPSGFTDGWPAQALDGELWLGRGRFEALSGLLRRDPARRTPADQALWQQVRYRVFDSPDAPGDWRSRLQQLQELLGPMVEVEADEANGASPRIAVLVQREVSDHAALQRWLRDVIAAGGEGLVLHAADAPHAPGRSAVLLKLKPQQDADAVVIAHLPGQGRHQGRLGALRVRDEAGRVFALGSGLSDAQRDEPPPVGARVSYRHRGLTRHGLPRFATFWRVNELP